MLKYCQAHLAVYPSLQGCCGASYSPLSFLSPVDLTPPFHLSYLWSLLGVRIKGIPRQQVPFLRHVATPGDKLVVDLLVNKRSTSGDAALSSVHHHSIVSKSYRFIHYKKSSCMCDFL